MLLNGSADGNLRVANRGKPWLEDAGAIVTQVVLNDEPHVPSTESMAEPLRAWLEGIEKVDARARGVSAVPWQDVLLSRRPKAHEKLAAVLATHTLVHNADKERPVLFLLHSQALGKKDKPTNAALASAALEESVFRYPSAFGPPSAARLFTCFRVDVSAYSKKESPRLHEAMAPTLVLLGVDRTVSTVIANAKPNGGRAIAKALRAHLSDAQCIDVDRRMKSIAPWIKEYKSVSKARAACERALAKARRKKAAKRTETRLLELKGLDKKLEALRERLVK